MNIEQLKKKIETGEAVELLDVREREEYEAGDKIPGSRNVPMGQVFLDAAMDKLPKDKKILAICKTGGRCEIVARELSKKGYDIEHLEGGIEAWKQANNS